MIFKDGDLTNLDISEKIRLAVSFSNKTLSEVAKEFGTSSSSFSQKLKRGTFKRSELEKIAQICGGEYQSGFIVDDVKIE